MSDQAFARQQMIEQQLRAWEVFDPRVLCVFDELRREDFVPQRFRAMAFADTAIPLGHGESMMTPKVEGRMLDALAIRPTDRVLEIGTGSGWITALCATLAAEVLSFDIVPEFTAAARQKLDTAGITNATVETRDAATLGGDAGAFDVIALTGSLPVYDERFERMLAPGGRLFVVTGDAPVMHAQLVLLDGERQRAVRSLFETELTPLLHFPRPSRFRL
jgi:protein-L-isoaspartate(D-aspartate) O-methyltransferase